MRKTFRLLMSVVAMSAVVGCTTDVTEDLSVKVGGKTQLTLSLDDTRTQLGDKTGDVYPLTWSEGDQISVNGVTSEPLTTTDGAGSASAVFTFVSTLQTPYFVAYPAAENTNQVVFPAEQYYSEYGAIDDGVTVMYGYSANGENIRLNSLNGILKIAFKGTATLTEARISTIDRKPIAGTFNAAYDAATESVTLTPVEGATSDVITYSFGSGLILSEDSETYIHIAVPAGLYKELYLTLEDSEGKIMYATVKAGSDKPLAAGKVREFSPAVEYVGVSESDSEFFILSDQMSLVNFKTALEEAEATLVKADATDEQKAAATATLQKKAVMVNDIEVREVMDLEHKAINAPNYTGEFNGNGYAIIFDKSFTDDKKLTEPLFDSVAATIKGVHLKGVYITNYNSANTGALANTYLGTSISHCSSAGKIDLSRSTNVLNRIGGLVGYLPAMTANCVVSDCVNNCSIDVTLNQAASDEKAVAIAGVIGDAYCTAKGKALTISNCVNNATIDVDGNIGYSFSVAGILSRQHYIALVMDECHNKNNITVNLGASQNVNVAGVLARVVMSGSSLNTNYKSSTTNVTNSSNAGNITLNLSSKSAATEAICVGGCVGRLENFHQTTISLDNCDNSGDVVATMAETANPVLSSSVMVNATYVGGVAALMYGRAEVYNCDNTGENVTLNIGTMSTYSVVGGILGCGIVRALNAHVESNINYNPCEVVNGVNNADVTLNVTTQGKQQAMVGGCVGLARLHAQTHGHFAFDNLKNYGSVTATSNDWVMPTNYKRPLAPLTALGGIVGSNNLHEDISNFHSCNAYRCPFPITNCVNGHANTDKKIEVNGDKHYSVCAGGILGFNIFSNEKADGANGDFRIDNCINNMAIEHNSATESAEIFYGGGLMGYMSHMDGGQETVIINSINNGAINMSAKCANVVSVAGVIGAQKTHSPDGAAKNMMAILTGATNNGTITVGDATGFACSELYVGGVMGLTERLNVESTNEKFTFTDVVNKGNINALNVTASTSHNIGGAMANVNRDLANIQTFCTVTLSEGMKAGMLAGEASTTYAITGCSVGGTFVEGATSTTLDAANLTYYLFTDHTVASSVSATLLEKKEDIQ